MKQKNHTGKIIAAVVVIGIIALLVWLNNGPGQYDNFAQCLVDSEIKMYSAWWCPHCQDQKQMFGKSFKILDNGGVHVECSPGGTQVFSDFCRNTEGFQGTPMWKLKDGTILRGVQPLEILAQNTGCELP